jgi:Peptidase family M23
VPRPSSWAGAACAAALGLVLGAGPAAAAGGPHSDWGWPLAGHPRVVRAFDPPPQRWAAGHRGIDLLARDGAVVRAAGAGSVTFAGPLAGRGVVVVTHRNGTRTTYEPVTATVTRGERVGAGDALGRLTAANGHCLPLACLHWGRRRGDVYLDPMLLLRRGPARLLPVWAAARDGPALERTRSRPMAAGRSAKRATSRSPAPGLSWRLASDAVAERPMAAAAGLVGLVALASRRRRAQSRAGSSAASSA